MSVIVSIQHLSIYRNLNYFWLNLTLTIAMDWLRILPLKRILNFNFFYLQAHLDAHSQVIEAQFNVIGQESNRVRLDNFTSR